MFLCRTAECYDLHARISAGNPARNETFGLVSVRGLKLTVRQNALHSEYAKSEALRRIRLFVA
ncbi:MAG: hypothetical protein ABH950_03665 [Candidatus Altiarchaeota archaeon]